MSMFITVW